MIKKIILWMNTRKLRKLILPPDPINVFKQLGEAGFSSSQALAILNAISEMTKSNKRR